MKKVIYEAGPGTVQWQTPHFLRGPKEKSGIFGRKVVVFCRKFEK